LHRDITARGRLPTCWNALSRFQQLGGNRSGESHAVKEGGESEGEELHFLVKVAEGTWVMSKFKGGLEEIVEEGVWELEVRSL
jgi:hypothetical protein